MGHDHLAHPHWVQDPFSSPSFTQQGKPPIPMLVACCLLLCDSCFVPSMPFPSPRSVAFVQSRQCFSFTLLSIAPHPGTQTAPGSHLSCLLALSQPLISYPYLPHCSLFQLLLLFVPSGNLPLLHPKRISPLIPSTVLPSIYHWLIYHQPYAPKPSFQGSLGQIHVRPVHARGWYRDRRGTVPAETGTLALAYTCSCLHMPTPTCSCPRSRCQIQGCGISRGVLVLQWGTGVICAARLQVGIWAVWSYSH